MKNFKKSLYNFLERPKTTWAKIVYYFIAALIIISVVISVLEFSYWQEIKPYADFLFSLEILITAIFTAEYLLRWYASPKRLKFPFEPYNIIDLVAILPFYIGPYNSLAIRGLRILRLFKIFRYNGVVKAFEFKNSILQKIFPIITSLLLIKMGIWYLERNNYWIREQEFGILFTIIGFALGIILSQKIGVAYQKYIEVDAAIMRIKSGIATLELMLEVNKTKSAKKVCRAWIEVFLATLRKETPKSHEKFELANAKLYTLVRSSKKVPIEMLKVHADLTHDAIFCIGKKFRPTPKAYDNLLHQATLIYLLLIALFTPGFNGVISITMATYLLYGMYYVTVDFDYLFNKKYPLTRIETHELDKLLK